MVELEMVGLGSYLGLFEEAQETQLLWPED